MPLTFPKLSPMQGIPQMIQVFIESNLGSTFLWMKCWRVDVSTFLHIEEGRGPCECYSSQGELTKNYQNGALCIVQSADRLWKGVSMDEGTLKTPTPLCRFHWSFCLGWWSNLVGSASGQKQSVKFLQNMVYTAQFTPHPPPLRHSLSV